MPSIVVPVNHDPGALPAVECAALIAQSLAGTYQVLIVHVREPAHQDRIADQLDRALALLLSRRVEGSVLRLDGRKARSIAGVSGPDDLVVMRKRARVDTPRWEVGATTTDMLKLAPCPVLVVTDRVTSMSHALIAYNGSAQSRRAVETALGRLAPLVIARASLLAVTSDKHMGERLDAEVRTLARARDIELGRPCLRPGRPADVLEEELGASGAELLVMGAYGRRWLQELVFGSTTERMLKTCPVPIWFNN